MREEPLSYGSRPFWILLSKVPSSPLKRFKQQDWTGLDNPHSHGNIKPSFLAFLYSSLRTRETQTFTTSKHALPASQSFAPAEISFTDSHVCSFKTKQNKKKTSVVQNTIRRRNTKAENHHLIRRLWMKLSVEISSSRTKSPRPISSWFIMVMVSNSLPTQTHASTTTIVYTTVCKDGFLSQWFSVSHVSTRFAEH